MSDFSMFLLGSRLRRSRRNSWSLFVLRMLKGALCLGSCADHGGRKPGVPQSGYA